MRAMEELEAKVNGLWADFQNKKQTLEDAKIHHGYARIIIETNRVMIAERKLRLLSAVDVTPAIEHAPKQVTAKPARKRAA